MKKIFVMMCAFAAVIGCQKPELDMPQENEGVELKITADIAQTKTTMTNDNGVLKSTWKDGDKIYVQRFWDTCYGQENVLEYTAEVSGNTAIFSTEDQLKAPGVSANQYYRYTLLAEYPKALASHAINRNFSMSANQTQSTCGDLSHIAEADLMYAWSSVDWDANPICAEFNFQHILSVLQLDLKADAEGVLLNNLEVEMLDETGSDYLVITDGQINLRDGIITQKSGLNRLTLNFPVPVELSTDEYAQFYMTISPGHSGQTFKVTAITDMGEKLEIGSMKVPVDGAIPQGAKAVKSFTVTAPVTEDVDYASAIDLSANGTANTYLVNQANTLYKFKADVKGNGSVPSALTDIGVGTATTIAPKTALLLWYNCVQTSKAWVDQNPVDVSSIELKDGYIYFKTPATFVNGNAVIAAFAEEGLTYKNITVDENRLLTNATILWSWNIWASEGYDIEADAFTAGDFTIMGRNLGAAVGEAEIDSYQTAAERKYVAASAIGNYYQWGNKNPYPHVSDYENYEIPKYGNMMYCTPTYTPIVALKDSMNGNVAMPDQMFGTFANFALDLGTYLSEDDRSPANIVAYTESAPYKYLQNTMSIYGYNWTGNIDNTPLVHLWGDATLEDVTDHVKTIYDPCPEGWKVWEDDAWDAMVTAGAATAVIDMNAKDASKGGFGSIICDSYFATNGGGRSDKFVVNRLSRCGLTTDTAYAMSNPSIYSSSLGRKYMIQHKANFNLETDINLQIATFLGTGYSTPLRCVKE